MTKRETAREAALLASAQAGGRAAFDELLHKYEGPLFRAGRQLCGNDADARDMLQDTLLTAFRGLAAFRGQAKLSTWLYQLAKNSCARLRQRQPIGAAAARGSVPAELAEALQSDAASPDVAASVSELRGVLEAGLRALPEDSRAVLLLRDVQGATAEEAATELGLAVPALKSRLHRARKALREELERRLDVTER